MADGDRYSGTTEGATLDVAAQTEKINKEAIQIKSAAKGFAAAAGKGFHIEPEAAATLIKACQESLADLNRLSVHLANLRQAPQLGQSPGAQVIARFTQNVANDSEGIAPAIADLRATLNDMIKAYQQASTNYAETEAIIAQSLKGQ